MNNSAKIVLWLGFFMIAFQVMKDWPNLKTLLFTGGTPWAIVTPNPASKNTNQLGENKTGACPPGVFPPGDICLGM